MDPLKQPQDWEGAYNSTIKTVWWMIALSIVLSFIGAVKISYEYGGDIMSFISPNFSFIIMMISAVSTVGCFIGERTVSNNRWNLKSDKEIISHFTDISRLRGITVVSFFTFLIFFAVTPVEQFVPVLLDNRVTLSIFACVPLFLMLAMMWLKMAIRIRQEHLTPQR
jgi:hypothetical protein